MKCIYQNCDNEALEGSNYCSVHRKGGLLTLGRFSNMHSSNVKRKKAYAHKMNKMFKKK